MLSFKFSLAECQIYRQAYSADWEAELNCPHLQKQFEEKLCNMPGDESYFLLTTFANMAMARGYQDYDFVRTTTIDLFQVH